MSDKYLPPSELCGNPRRNAPQAAIDGGARAADGECTAEAGKIDAPSSMLALDPGPAQTGWCLYALGRIAAVGIEPNEQVLGRLQTEWAGLRCPLAIEMVASYGMPVGREVFETCVWIGRFQQAWRDPQAVRMVYRQQVKLHLCGSMRAKESNIRQALIDLLGPPGTKAKPGRTYGVTKHAWSALAVAITALEAPC